MGNRRVIMAPAALAFAFGMAALAGCGRSMVITQYPSFYTQDMRTVAVLQFDNESLRPRAGHFVTRRFTAALKENGTYEVLGSKDASAIAKAQAANPADPAELKAVAVRFKEAGNVQVFIVGSVKTFTSASYVYRWSEPGFGYRYYRFGTHWYYPTDFYVHNEARVSVAARLVLVDDGTVLAETPELSATVFSRGDPPHLTPDECAAKATGQVIDEMLECFAAVKKQVVISPKKNLRTARRREGGGWQFTDKFSPDDEAMYVIVKLPDECDRNRFRVAISREGHKEALAGEDFVWSKQDESRQLKFSPNELHAKAGAGDYRVTFYSGPDRVLAVDVKIK